MPAFPPTPSPRVGTARLIGGLETQIASSIWPEPPTEETRRVELILGEITEEVKTTVNRTFVAELPPQELGTMLHTMFAEATRAAVTTGRLPPTVAVEQSYANGADARYGGKGSYRTDIVLKDAADGVIAIWDYKTGAGSYMSSTRVDAMKNAVVQSKILLGISTSRLFMCHFTGSGNELENRQNNDCP